MAKKHHIQIYTESCDYFNELIIQASKDTKKNTRKQSVNYLSCLLDAYVKAPLNTPQSPDASDLPPTLALLEAQALPPNTQLRIYKALGDFSLFLSGIFMDTLFKQILDLDYYLSIGGTSYHMAHSVSLEDEIRATFLDLSINFLTYIEILNKASENIGLFDNTNLLNLYEKWALTKSKNLEKLLRTHGFDLTQAKTPKSH